MEHTNQHTPTPWKIEERGMYSDDIRGGGSNSPIVCMLSLDAKTLTEMKANARRIVACVNACEGIDTEVLEALPLNFKQHAIEFEILKAQNARLLEALKGFAEYTGEMIYPVSWQDVVRETGEKARAAISEAEQTTAP